MMIMCVDIFRKGVSNECFNILQVDNLGYVVLLSTQVMLYY